MFLQGVLDRMATAMDEELIQDVWTGKRMVNRGNIMTLMTPSVKAEAVSDPTAPQNTLAAPVRRRSDDAGGIPERLAAVPALKPIKGHSGSSSECAGRF